MKQYTKPNVINALSPGLFVDYLLTMKSRPERSISSQSLGKYRQILTTITTKRQNTYKCKLMIHQKWP